MPTIAELNKNVRDIINNPRKRCVLLDDPASWNMLCSCLDVIGDTELALDAFLKQGDFGDNGTNYLLIYGVLQALFIQQDAVEDLAEALKALNVTYTRSELLKEIREVRNDSIGHPTKRDFPKNNGPSNRMVRMSLSHDRFVLVKNYPDRRTECLDVDIIDLIQKQRANLAATLTSMADKLKEDDMKHKRQFEHEKLQDLFPSTIDYDFEKIYGVCDRNESPEIGATAIKITFAYLEKFKTALQTRGILKAYEFVVDDLDLIEYSLTGLRKFIEGSPDSTLDSKSANIFAFFAREHIDSLLETAKEIDKEYASDELSN
ncbi:MAG TPA: hypothetical protein DCQ92_02460 [Verrucomicrobia subdivision 3 bacterium]|nr:hypothetical protein [Limisphaerales bacterium]